jgi:hypothetical protein
MRDEQRIDIPCHTGRIVSQCHRRAAYHEHIRDDAAPDQALAQGGERPFELCPVEEDAPGSGHAASRSAADRYTPCFRNAAGARTRASARWTRSSAGNHGRCRTRISVQAGGARLC